MDDYVALKTFLTAALTVERDTLHVLAGLILQFAFAQVTRRRIADWSPVLFVFVLACLNEVADLQAELWHDLALQYGESAKDLILTMIPPLALMAVARYRPALLIRRIGENKSVEAFDEG